MKLRELLKIISEDTEIIIHKNTNDGDIEIWGNGFAVCHPMKLIDEIENEVEFVYPFYGTNGTHLRIELKGKDND